MWKGQARIELNLHTPRIQRFRILLVLALIATLVQALPSFTETASATAPFTSSSNAACAASIANTNQNSGVTAMESKWDGTYCYLRFTTETPYQTHQNYWQYPTGVTQFDYLIVAGGGGGGSGNGSAFESGGGGAGGLITGTFSTNNSTSHKISIQIGQGGAAGSNGANSFIKYGNAPTLIAEATGGGAGGSASAGAAGGSGGGGSHNQNSGGARTSSPIQGNEGGTPSQAGRGAGGGGWATAGGSDSYGGDGYTDSSYTYWPSGSNSSYYKLAWGGAGVKPGTTISSAGTGGTAPSGWNNGGDAVNDTGSGGGGAYGNDANVQKGGKGADGVVYIRYIPSQTDGLNLYCYYDEGIGNFTKSDIDASTSVTSDTIWPFPGDDYASHGYGTYGPRDCGTPTADMNYYTEYLSGYIKAPVSGTVYLIGFGDDGIAIDVEDDTANGYRNVLDRRLDDGGGTRIISTALTWTSGKWYKIGVWHHENGGGSSLTIKYNTSTNGATVASDNNIPRTNLNNLKGSTATLAYQSVPGLVNQNILPIFTSTSNAASDGAKTYTTPANSFCSVNSSTGVITTLATGPCFITVRTARTSTFSAQVYTVRVRTAVSPYSETDTALNLNTNARAAYKSDWALMTQSMTMASEQSFTVETWINPTQTSGNILQLGTPPNGSTAGSGFRVFLEAASSRAILKVAFSGFGASNYTCDREVPLNRWSHVAIGITLGTAGRATSKVKCYLDGFLVSDQTPSSPQDTSISNGLWIGNDSSFANTLGGLIDEVKIWKTLRDQLQIQTDMKEFTSPSSTNLVGYFNFNEGAASVAFNSYAYADDASDLTISSITSANWVPVASATVGATGAEAYTYWQFNRSYITAFGGWKVPSGITRAKILMIGGGGAGGNIAGGGGGAGGLYETVLTIGGYETVTIGAGGAGYYRSTNAHASDGGRTYFADKVTYGGGAGGSAASGNTNGNGGGSGGGAAYYSTASGTGGGGGTPGYGLTYSGGSPAYSGYGAGGAGAVASGSAATSSSSGTGGTGYLSSITGISTCYATGGGGADVGGSQNTAGGTCTGFTNPNYNDGSPFYNKYQTWVSPNTGAGGGAAGSTNDASNKSMGQAGSAGVVIVRYLTPLKPSFTIPASVDTTTAGKAYQFVIGGSALNPLTRGYTWQWTNGTASSWVNYTTSDTSTLNLPSPETTTSGANYSYRVIVTDSDSDGFSTTDTSTAFYLIINPRNTITSSTGSNTLSLKYGDTLTATFSFANGTGTRTPSYAATTANQAGSFVWSNASSNSITFTVVPGVWAGTYTETLTITDSVSAFTTQAITIILGKADTVTVSTTISSSSKNYDGLPGPTAVGSITGLKGSDAAVSATATSCRTGGTCVVGDIAPGGGYVFYVSPSVIDTATGISGGGLYLATAPTANWTTGNFCSVNSVPTSPAYLQGIGGGAENTRRLASVCASGSIVQTTSDLSITDEVTGEVVNDWFVPSEDELKTAMKFYVAQSPTGTLPVQDANGTYYYWSSYVLNFQQTQVIIKTAVSPYYMNVYGTFSPSGSTANVGMPIRAFSPSKNSLTYTATSCATGGTCVVGDAAPGGGYVFYVSGYAIDSATGISDGGIYLASAPYAQIKKATWCNKDLSVTGWGNGYGAGAANTKLLVENCSAIDAGPTVAALWDINGYDDWFLPSQSESGLMYSTLIATNKVSLAAITDKSFWTSSLATASRAYYSQFQSPSGLGDSTATLTRTNLINYWPIRAFSPAVVNSYSPPSDAGVYDITYKPVFNAAVNTTNYQAIVYNKATYTINRAAPPAMIIPMYGAVVGTPLYFAVYGGKGNGPLFRSVVTPGTSACTFDTATVTLNATANGPCVVRSIHGGNKNVFTDTLTATIFWMTFLPDVVVSTPGGPHAIPISDGNQVVSRTDTVTSTSFTDTNGLGITSAPVNTRIRILVSGFDGLSTSDLTVYFKPYEDAVINEVTATYVDVTIPSTAITGKIGIDGPRGVTYSPIFTVTP